MQANQLSAESIRTQLRKILSSSTFARSERLARFLNFTIDETLEGRGNQLKEFVIGVEVFDKTEKYDPRMDPIVRVEARRLREKLRKYYETEGRQDALHIEFPTGSYAPVVQTRDSVVASGAAGAAVENAIAVLPFANLSSEQAEAERLWQALDRCCRTCCVSSYLLARAQLGFDHDRAFAFLEQALEERDPRLPHLNVSPIWDCLRADPRFAGLASRMGLAVSEPQSL